MLKMKIYCLLFVCFSSIVLVHAACPVDFVLIANSCYYFDKANVRTWANARIFCQGREGDLAVINECNAFHEIVNYIRINAQLPDGFSYWIGGSDQGEEGAWYWIDFSPMTMGLPFWGSANGISEPSGGITENCATLNKDNGYYFNDGNCEGSTFTLCQAPIS